MSDKSTETPTPHRAPADAQPSEEALRAARDNVRCDVVGCLSVCGQCMRTAMLLDRFRAAGARDWQPIETAPKDGTEILVNDGDITAIAHWNDRWSESWTGEDFNPTGDQPAIRWMPLPETPHDR